MDPKELRSLYNHYVWPSPRARVVAKNLGCTTKRLTHEQALNWLAEKAGTSLDNFLSLEKYESWKMLKCTTWRGGREYIYDPLYGLYSPYYLGGRHLRFV
jgi:hypothetical protein